jgi:hypothetical protein
LQSKVNKRISLIATIGGIYIALKYSLLLGKVTFLKEQTIPLFDTIVKNLPELSVSFKGKPVSPKLFLIKGALLNSGKRDISTTMVENPITINLPEDYKWLEAKVINTSPNVRASINFIGQTSILFETGLFRNGEYIRFEALIEAPTEGADKIDKAIQFSHRIADLRKITKSEIKEVDINPKHKWMLISLPVLGLIFFGYFIFSPKHDIIYSYKNANDKIIKVKINSIKKNQIKIEGIDNENKYNEIINPDKFYSHIQGIDFKEKSLFIRENLIVFAAYIFFPIAFLIFLYIKNRKNKKLRMILNI